jgi:hypothetical protein
MNAIYPTKYRDRAGEVVATMTNDGNMLSVVLRGVEFRGGDFDALEPVGGPDPDRLASFTFQHGCLCACEMEVEMPVLVATPRGDLDGRLVARLELGDPAPNGGIDREYLLLRLGFGDRVLASRGWSGWFEDELADLQRQMPEGTYLKACVTCAFSDYSPVGHGLFGGLACFRGNKAGYRAVRSKADLFRVWDTMTGFVQETFLCPEFERRSPGTGYRG